MRIATGLELGRKIREWTSLEWSLAREARERRFKSSLPDLLKAAGSTPATPTFMVPAKYTGASMVEVPSYKRLVVGPIPTRCTMKHPKKTGELTEQIIICEFMKLDVPVSKPVGDNQPYDLIVDLNNRLYKIQSRTGRIRVKPRSSIVMFNALSYRVNTSGVYVKDQRSNFDYFAVYCPQNDKLYLLSSRGVKADHGRLSLSGSKKLPNAVDNELFKVVAKIMAG